MTSTLENVRVLMDYETFADTLYPKPPKYTELTFTRYAWTKMIAYCHLIDKYEITGFGRVVDNKVIDVKILEQKVQPALVDCDEDAMSEFLMGLPMDEIGQWVLDWHSHVDLGAFASGTDTTNYDKQFLARMKNQYPYLIVNKRNEYCCKCYINPTRATDITLTVDDSILTEDDIKHIYEECKHDIETLCSRTTYTYTGAKTTHTNRAYNYYADDDDYDYNWYNNYYNKYYGYSSNSEKLPTTHNGGSLSKKKDQDYDDEVAKNMQEIDERAYQQALDFKNNADLDDFCESCGIYLQSATEYDRGLCDDCWEKMSNQEQLNWSTERLTNE